MSPPPNGPRHCKIFARMSLLHVYCKMILDRMAARFSETGRTVWSQQSLPSSKFFLAYCGFLYKKLRETCSSARGPKTRGIALKWSSLWVLQEFALLDDVGNRRMRGGHCPPAQVFIKENGSSDLACSLRDMVILYCMGLPGRGIGTYCCMMTTTSSTQGGKKNN